MDFTKTNLIISSREPEKLGRFYSSLIGLKLSGGFGLKDFCIRSSDPLKINFYKPSNENIKARINNKIYNHAKKEVGKIFAKL